MATLAHHSTCSSSGMRLDRRRASPRRSTRSACGPRTCRASASRRRRRSRSRRRGASAALRAADARGCGCLAPARCRRRASLPVPSRMRTLVKRTLGPWRSPRVRPPSACVRAERTGRRAVELAVLHHRQDARLVLQHGDVGERVAVDQQQVGEVAFAHVAERPCPCASSARPRRWPRAAPPSVLMPTYLTKYSRSFALVPCGVQAKP